MTGVFDRPTGAELVAALYGGAREAGVPILDYLLPLTRYPTSWLMNLGEAARPTAATVGRVRALLAGEAVPSATSPTLVVTPDPIPPGLRLDRDPCCFCGTRGDLGCAHRLAAEPWDPFADQRRAA